MELLFALIGMAFLAAFVWFIDKKDKMYDDLEYYDDEEL